MENVKHSNLIIYFVVGLVLLMSSCNRNNPTPRPVAPAEYATAYVKAHGKCYDSIPAAVLSLDLYSDGLQLDSARRMQGTGYNLYLSDIFVSDSVLSSGLYQSDTTGEKFTFLPGMNYEGLPSGAYLLRVNEGVLETIILLDSGRMEVRDTIDGIVDIRFVLYNGREQYNAHYQGSLLRSVDE